MKLWPLLLVTLCGCAVERFNMPPYWATAITTHATVYGLDASIPIGGGASVGVKLGLIRSSWSALPVSTNAVFIPKFSDTFSAGQTINPFDMRVRQYLQAGWEGEAVPPPAMMFAPTQSPKDSSK